MIIRIPPLTEERRREVVKIVKKFAEEAKISVRNVRADILKSIKKQETDRLISEDQVRDLETNLQKQIDEANKYIEELTKKKEADVMKV